MIEYGICPECDNELDQITDEEDGVSLWQCSLCDYEVEGN